MNTMKSDPLPTHPSSTLSARRKAAIGIGAVFITQFVSFLFINARNIAVPGIIHELQGMALFSWLIALPALAGAASTLLFGKLGDVYGRRNILLLSMGIFLAGLALASRSQTMPFLVAASTFMSIGHFPIIPLCFSSIGDLFPAEDRAKWTGLLNLPSGVAAIIGPVLGGLVSESALGWRGLYWGTIPLLLIAGGLVAAGMPKAAAHGKPKMDIWGTVMMLAATSTLFIGVSMLKSPGNLGLSAMLLAVSAAAWVGFISVEKRTEAPILDPQVLFNRTFLTAAGASLLSCFGMLGIMAYSPVFVQTVMKLDPTASGSMLTPYTTIVAFIGIPTGLVLARRRKYKVMYNVGYALVAVCMYAMWRFTAATPAWWYVLATSLGGLGMGTVGTINTLAAQFSVPKRLLGAAVGAIFFFQMVGLTIAPAILGLVLNNAQNTESGLKQVFLVGAIAMTVSLVMILTIPELSMGSGSAEKKYADSRQPGNAEA